MLAWISGSSIPFWQAGVAEVEICYCHFDHSDYDCHPQSLRRLAAVTSSSLHVSYVLAIVLS